MTGERKGLHAWGQEIADLPFKLHPRGRRKVGGKAIGQKVGLL